MAAWIKVHVIKVCVAAVPWIFTARSSELRPAVPGSKLRSILTFSRALEKVRMLRSFDPGTAGRSSLDLGIEDPWYGGHADFDATWTLIHAAIPGIVESVKTAIRDADETETPQPQQVTSMT